MNAETDDESPGLTPVDDWTPDDLREIQDTIGIIADRVAAIEARSEAPDHLATAFATSPEIDKIATALAEAQGEFGEIKKTKTATIRDKNDYKKVLYEYNYADLADVVSATAKPLAAHGICVTQPTIRSRDGVFVVTMLMHSSGQWIRSNLSMPVGDHKPQTLGSASTYGRRYSLCSMLGVASEADDDGQAAQDKADGKPPPPDGPRAGTRTVTKPPKGNEPKPEPQHKPKNGGPADDSRDTRLRDALAAYRQASGDPDTAGRALMAQALGKPWPKEPSDQQRETAIMGFTLMTRKAAEASEPPKEYDPGDGKGDEVPDPDSHEHGD